MFNMTQKKLNLLENFGDVVGWQVVGAVQCFRQPIETLGSVVHVDRRKGDGSPGHPTS